MWEGTLAEFAFAKTSGIVIGDALASYWPIFSLPPVTVPEVFSKVNLEQFPSHFQCGELVSATTVSE